MTTTQLLNQHRLRSLQSLHAHVFPAGRINAASRSTDLLCGNGRARACKLYPSFVTLLIHFCAFNLLIAA